MRKRRLGWGTVGFLWAAAAGTLLQFVYEWSGGSIAAAVFSGVNESVWEHMKLLVMPVFLFTAAQMWAQGESLPNLPAVRAASLTAGVFIIPVLYYTYTGALGFRVLWVDMGIFYLAAALTFWLDGRLVRTGRFSSVWAQVLGIAALWALVFVFVWCTFRPPHLPLWQDPVTGGYGIPRG